MATAASTVLALKMGSTAMYAALRATYQVASGFNAFMDRHLAEMRKSDIPTVERSGRVLEGCKAGFGIGYIAPVVVICAGQLLLGNPLSAAATVATAATATNPVAMTCAAVGAVFYGYSALTASEREDILQRIGTGLELGLELVRSIVEFAVSYVRKILSSEQIAEFKRYIREAAELFGRHLGDVTGLLADRIADGYTAVRDTSAWAAKGAASLAVSGAKTVTTASAAAAGAATSALLRKQARATSVDPAIVNALAELPKDLLDRSGSVFYSGRSAFGRSADLYILGLNPGGCPVRQADETVKVDLAEWHNSDHEHWSAYVDEAWAGSAQGEYGMQPRIRHMFNQLKRDLKDVPAANLFFVRSRNEAALTAEKEHLIRACWPVHEAVLGSLQVRVVLALGGTTGKWVREQLGAHELVGEFRETNARGWTSQAHQAGDGRAVITVAHPARADWRNPAADPTPLVRSILGL